MADDYFDLFVKKADASGISERAICARAKVHQSTIVRNRNAYKETGRSHMTPRIYQKLLDAMTSLAREEVKKSRRRLRQMQNAGLVRAGR